MPAEWPFAAKDFTALTADLLGAVRDPLGGRVPLTDAAEGSVMRTLLEAFARELAVAYQQLGFVYDSAYIGTAAGAALDNVVALLGIERQRAGYLTGTAEFQRATLAEADITIPAGTLVAGRGKPVFATVRDVVMASGERRASVEIRSVEPGGDTVEPGKLNLMPRPIAGIEPVGNPGALILRQREENDDELRTRAAKAVRGANTGTVSAIEQAVRSLGIAEVKVLEDFRRAPGVIQVVLGDMELPDNLKEQARDRIEEVRPAGVSVTVKEATRIVVRVTATLRLSEDLPAAATDTIRAYLLQSLRGYFAQLAVGESVRIAKVQSILTSHDKVVAIDPGEGRLRLDPVARDDASSSDDVSAASRHLLKNGDIAVGATERVVLGAGDLAPVLRLEPLNFTVWIEVRLTTATTDEQQAAARGRLANLLDGVARMLDQTVASAQRSSVEITYAQLAGCLPAEASTGARFTVMHDEDGRSIELRADNDSDKLTPRERPQLSRFLPAAENG
jgi:uncharacterized phage protein gp47/JayE